MPSPYESFSQAACRPLDSEAPTSNILTWGDRDEDLVIGRRLERVSRHHADSPAIVLDDASWSYRELADASQRVAALLLGIRSEGRVALYLSSPFHHLAAAFGAWKAGWVTIPMDPRYPSDRNGQILHDADPHLILTDATGRGRLGRDSSRLIEDRPIERYDPVSRPESARPDREIGPETPSTILYTSGSTGRPKGVLHTHASLMHMTRRRSRMSRIRPDDAHTLLYSPSVMGGLSSFLTPLLNGASLHPRDIRNDGFIGMATWLRHHRITCCHCVTSLFREFTRLIEPGCPFPDLRLIILGGEQAYPADIELGRRVFGPHVEFSCGIGSTEINTIRFMPVPTGRTVPPGRIPYGFAVEGVDVLILDQNRQPLPQGEIGEMAVRSRYLSRGYWRNPEQTRQRYLPDPEGSDATVYLTGDLGRIDESGCLSGAGRNDHQLKIRGFRVEPGEVNAHLMNQAGVAEACTIGVSRASGTLSLASFYTTTGSSPPRPAELRRALAADLPDYMVPDHLVELKAFPRTANGKIDQAALRLAEQPSEEGHREPGTPTESLLAGLWASVLERGTVPVDTPFFELGGTSLSAVTLLAQIEKRTRRQLPVSALFQHSTIIELARFLDLGSTRPPRASLVPIRPKGNGSPLYLIGGMTGELFFCHRLLRHLQADRPVHGLEPDTLSGGLTRHHKIEEVAKDYADAILAQNPEGAFVLAGYSFGGTVAYELARQLAKRGRPADLTLIIDSAAPRTRVGPNGSTQVKHDPKPKAGVPVRRKSSTLRFLHPSWWLRSKGAWRRSYWRLKYVKLYEQLVRLGFSPPVTWRRCYAYWQTHWMGHRYRAQPFGGPVVLFRSEARQVQGDRGWRDLCGDSLKLIPVPGDHGSMFREPHVEVLARELDRVLASTLDPPQHDPSDQVTLKEHEEDDERDNRHGDRGHQQMG